VNVDSFIRFENDVRAHGGHKWVGYADGGSIAFQGAHENSEMKIHRSSKSTSVVSKGQHGFEHGDAGHCGLPPAYSYHVVVQKRDHVHNHNLFS
jgi:hypothetical protein